MSSEYTNEEHQLESWDVGRRFRVVAALAVVLFSIFAAFDGQAYYARYLKRCEEAPDRPECAFLNVSKPKSRPELGIAMDHATGRWALQIEAGEEKSASETANRLWSAGASPRLIKVIGRNKTAFYYIQLGRFKSQKEAFGAGSQLKARGLLQDFVVAEFKQESK
jgi:hypothetical protein